MLNSKESKLWKTRQSKGKGNDDKDNLYLLWILSYTRSVLKKKEQKLFSPFQLRTLSLHQYY